MSGFALTCTADGAIAEIVRDDVGLGDVSSFAELFDDGSVPKGESFLAAVRDEGYAVGWSLNVRLGTRVRALQFAGGAFGERLLIVAAPGSARDNDLYDELSRLNNELINRERELGRKTAALERANAEKNRLMAIAAHDLRTPLTVIASYADLLQMEGAVSGDHLSYVEEISRSAKFMSELVEETLDSARLESGVTSLDLQELDLVEAARHAAAVNRMRADRKQIAVDFEATLDRLLIRADAVKLRQIINNLVVNAIKFSPVRRTVTIRVEADEANAVLEVADQGIGIAPDHLAMIFEPFATIRDSGTAGEKSTGLGLTIVKQLVALHHGSVSVHSVEGEGSVFRVLFPRVIA
jgi:signal transduction histidine kinase